MARSHDTQVDEYVVNVRGGGRGWTASIGDVEAKATSKQGAIDAVIAQASNLDLREAEVEVDDDMSEGEIERCVAECATSEQPYCECKCGGENHGSMAVAKTAGLKAVLGPKPCLCGCGTVTRRLFAPGHDARYHAAQKRAAQLATFGGDEAALEAAIKAAKAAKAKVRRDAKRANDAVVTAKAEQVAATIS